MGLRAPPLRPPDSAPLRGATILVDAEDPLADTARMARIENLLLEGEAGRIEAFVRIPPDAHEPAAAALVCHPHPLFGGTMHNKVVHAAAEALVSAGLPVLRFNFRGVGMSEGAHDGGRGEVADAQVALRELQRRYPGLPVLLAGYSFGASVGLRAGCAEPRVEALIGIGVPLALDNMAFLTRCAKPLTLIQGENDGFGPLSMVMALAAAVPSGARVAIVPGAAHNFQGKLEELGRRVSEAIPEVMRAAPRPR
jgi:uncharacterized protein